MSDQTTLAKFGYQKRKIESPKKSKKRSREVRATPSVISPDHLEEDNPDLQVLRAFDLDPTYGPAIGIARIDRWKRAKVMGLNPDPVIEDLILQHEDDSKYSQCIWSGTLVDCSS